MRKKMKFTLLNHLSRNDVESAKYVVYAHRTGDGEHLYIGQSSDPVERWRDHALAAKDELSPYYGKPFKDAIRKYGDDFNHYIIAVANSQNQIDQLEAKAIDYYKPDLNVRSETNNLGEASGWFLNIDWQLGERIDLAVKRNKTSKSVLENQDQQEVIAEVISDKGRKRLRVIAGQAFEQGLMVSVSRSERERFDYGDKVKVFASKAYRRGTAFLQVSPKAELSAA